MGDVLFDLALLKPFATGMGPASTGLGALDGEIRSLRDDARPLLNSTMPSDLPGPRQKPDWVATLLLEVQTEVRRRIALLEQMQALEALGLPVDYSHALASDLVDEDDVEAAVRAIKGLPDKDTGINGNRDDLEALQRQLEALNAQELDAVLDGLTDAELAELGGMLRDTDGSNLNLFDSNGLERWERLEFYGVLLRQVSPSRLDRLAEAWPEVNPSFDTTDVFLEGENSQTGENASGIHWGVPSGPVFATDEDGNPVADPTQTGQGTFADCWFVASMLAAQGADPEFIPEHMQVNPNGTVSVKMYDDDGDGHWVTVTPDLPVDEDGDPVGVNSDDGSLWGAYYEKAFALAYQGDEGGAPDGKDGDPDFDRAEVGTYGATEWDYNDQAPPYITGNEGDGLGHDFEGVQEAFGDGRPVIVSTGSDKPDPPDDWQGYSERHVYYVTAVGDDTITVSNPWGADYGSITMTEDEFEKYFGDATALEMKG